MLELATVVGRANARNAFAPNSHRDLGLEVQMLAGENEARVDG